MNKLKWSLIPARSTGVALPIALVFLSVLAVLSTSGLQQAILNETLTSNEFQYTQLSYVNESHIHHEINQPLSPRIQNAYRRVDMNYTPTAETSTIASGSSHTNTGITVTATPLLGLGATIDQSATRREIMLHLTTESVLLDGARNPIGDGKQMSKGFSKWIVR